MANGLPDGLGARGWRPTLGVIAVDCVSAIQILIIVTGASVEVFLQVAQVLSAEAEIADAVRYFADELAKRLPGGADQFLGET